MGCEAQQQRDTQLDARISAEVGAAQRGAGRNRRGYGAEEHSASQRCLKGRVPTRSVYGLGFAERFESAFQSISGRSADWSVGGSALGPHLARHKVFPLVRVPAHVEFGELARTHPHVESEDHTLHW